MHSEIQGDCVVEMARMAENSVDAIVTDPPYGLEFMGKEWDRLAHGSNHPLNPHMEVTKETSGEPRAKDNPWQKEASGYGAPRKNARCRRCGRLRFTANPCECDTPDWDTRTREYAQLMQAWHYRWAVEALRVLKPGGHLLAFGGTRTSHRLVCALEDAGFEIRDTICWLYGSGFPKSLDVSKAIDKAAGAERPRTVIPNRRSVLHGDRPWMRDPAHRFESDEAVTEEAVRWAGWGTALKPAHEPICVARKPLSERNVSANVLRWGTGGLNVDGCRVASGDSAWHRPTPADPMAWSPRTYAQDAWTRENMVLLKPETGGHGGRWPANVCLDGEAAAMLGQESRFFFVAVDQGSSTWYTVPTGGVPCGDESGRAGGMSAGRPVGNSDGNLSTDGFGSKPTGLFPLGTISITETETRSTMRFPIWNVLSGSRIGMVIIEYEKPTKPLTVNSIASVRSAGNGSILIATSDGQQAHIRGTVRIVNESPSENGARRIGNGITPTCEPTDASPNVSRFFYCAKASRAEREAGLESLATDKRDQTRVDGHPGGDNPRNRGLSRVRNVHPTVKPVELMRWLVRLVTPPGGTVLDPFMGSGTTGMACAWEGFGFVGIEQDAGYAEIARLRIAWAEANRPAALQDGEPVEVAEGLRQGSVFPSGSTGGSK